MKSKTTGLKAAYLWQFGFFFPLQPQLPKTAQDRKFILEMCVKSLICSVLLTQMFYCSGLYCKLIIGLIGVYLSIGNIVYHYRPRLYHISSENTLPQIILVIQITPAILIILCCRYFRLFMSCVTIFWDLILGW